MKSNDEKLSYGESMRRNLHYLSTKEGAEKIGNAFQAIVMDTHNLLKQIKVLRDDGMNKVGIVAGLLVTCEFNRSISAISSIVEDFRTMDDITRLSQKTKVEESVEVSPEKSTKENSEESVKAVENLNPEPDVYVYG